MISGCHVYQHDNTRKVTGEQTGFTVQAQNRNLYVYSMYSFSQTGSQGPELQILYILAICGFKVSINGIV